jgi:hypothetical protein
VLEETKGADKQLKTLAGDTRSVAG